MFGLLPRPINHTEIGQLSEALTPIAPISSVNFTFTESQRHYQLKPDYDVVLFIFLVTFYSFVAILLKKRDRERKLN